MDERKEREWFVLRWIDRISEVAGYLSGVCVFAATLVICYAIVVRASGHSTTWQTELAVYLLIFVTFVGGAYGLKHGAHVSVDLLHEALPARGRLVLSVVQAVLALVLLAIVGWYAFWTWWEASSKGWTSGTAWNPPLMYVYAILPLGMALISLQYVAVIIRAVRDLVRGRPAQSEGVRS